jgi:hypothetical protein
MSRPDVGWGREVAERVKKITSVPEIKKKEELLMKLLDDPNIPTIRRNPRRPHHSHKPLDVAGITNFVFKITNIMIFFSRSQGIQ